MPKYYPFNIIGSGANLRIVPVGVLSNDELSGATAVSDTNIGKNAILRYIYNAINNIDPDSSNTRNYKQGLDRMVAGNYGGIDDGNGINLPQIYGNTTYSNLRTLGDGSIVLDFNYNNKDINHTGYLYSRDKGKNWSIVTNFDNPYAKGGIYETQWGDSDFSQDEDRNGWAAAKEEIIYHPVNTYPLIATGTSNAAHRQIVAARKNKGLSSNDFLNFVYANEPLIDAIKPVREGPGYDEISTVAEKIGARSIGGRLDHSNFYKRGGRLNYFNIYGGKN